MSNDEIIIAAELHYVDGRIIAQEWTAALHELIGAPGGNQGLREIWLNDGAGWYLAFVRSDDDAAFEPPSE